MGVNDWALAEGNRVRVTFASEHSGNGVIAVSGEVVSYNYGVIVLRRARDGINQSISTERVRLVTVLAEGRHARLVRAAAAEDLRGAAEALEVEDQVGGDRSSALSLIDGVLDTIRGVRSRILT